MNAEQLRALSLTGLLDEISRQVAMAKDLAQVSGLWRESLTGERSGELPVISIGDFDIWPRGQEFPSVAALRAKNSRLAEYNMQLALALRDCTQLFNAADKGGFVVCTEERREKWEAVLAAHKNHA